MHFLFDYKFKRNVNTSMKQTVSCAINNGNTSVPGLPQTVIREQHSARCLPARSMRETAMVSICAMGKREMQWITLKKLLSTLNVDEYFRLLVQVH